MAFSISTHSLEPTDDSGGLTEDVLFQLLSSSRRRDVLRYLQREDGVSTLSEMTEAVATEEGMEAGSSAATYKPIYVSLYQTHIPRLEEAGVVDFDIETGMISLTARADMLLAHLEPERDGARESFFGRFVRSHLGHHDSSLS